MQCLKVSNLHILQLDLPDAIKEIIPDIHNQAISIFLSQKKTPIDIITNEVSNSFLHTHIAPLLQEKLGLTRSKEDVKKYINQHSKHLQGKTIYEKRWNLYQILVKKYMKDEEFKMNMIKLMTQPVYEVKKNSIYKLKLLALLAYVRFVHPKGMEKMPRVNQLWQYVFGYKLPTKKKLQLFRISKEDYSDMSTDISNEEAEQLRQSIENDIESFNGEEIIQEVDEDEPNKEQDSQIGNQGSDISQRQHDQQMCQNFGIKLMQEYTNAVNTRLTYDMKGQYQYDYTQQQIIVQISNIQQQKFNELNQMLDQYDQNDIQINLFSQQTLKKYLDIDNFLNL